MFNKKGRLLNCLIDLFSMAVDVNIEVQFYINPRVIFILIIFKLCLMQLNFIL